MAPGTGLANHAGRGWASDLHSSVESARERQVREALAVRRLQVEEENDGLAFDRAVHLGERVVDMDLQLYGVPVRLTTGRYPWLALVAVKHGDVVVFYRRVRLESHFTQPGVAATIAGAAEGLFHGCMVEGWDGAPQEFVTTVVGARTLRSVMDDLNGVNGGPAPVAA